MLDKGDKVAKSGITTRSTDSSSGSAFLSDTYVAVTVAKPTKGSRHCVRAPEGSFVMEV
jgi:hypothetical protein